MLSVKCYVSNSNLESSLPVKNITKDDPPLEVSNLNSPKKKEIRNQQNNVWDIVEKPSQESISI